MSGHCVELLVTSPGKQLRVLVSGYLCPITSVYLWEIVTSVYHWEIVMSTTIQSLYRITSDVYWAIVTSSSVQSLCRITSDWVTVTSPRTIY